MIIPKLGKEIINLVSVNILLAIKPSKKASFKSCLKITFSELSIVIFKYILICIF